MNSIVPIGGPTGTPGCPTCAHLARRAIAATRETTRCAQEAAHQRLVVRGLRARLEERAAQLLAAEARIEHQAKALHALRRVN